MKKSYDIGGRTLTLRSNVHTWFAYKSQFGRELAEDLKRAMELDGQRQAAGDVEEARIYAEECRTFLQIFWAFADEGTPDMPPFDRWLTTVSGVDMPDIIGTVTELYVSTMKPDKRYRVGQKIEDGSPLTTEELAEMIYSTGADSLALRDLTVGMALNLAHAHINALRRAKGEKVSDPEQQYKQIKEMLEAIDSGEIPMESVDLKEYERLKEAVKEWEESG